MIALEVTTLDNLISLLSFAGIKSDICLNDDVLKIEKNGKFKFISLQFYADENVPKYEVILTLYILNQSNDKIIGFWSDNFPSRDRKEFRIANQELVDYCINNFD
jgi:hypothetical protein